MKFILMLLISVGAWAKSPFKVAIMDTGFAPLPMDNAVHKLCEEGHYDYNDKEAKIGVDLIGHGSYVTYLVNDAAKTKNICFIIYKVLGRNIKDSKPKGSAG